MRDEARDRLLEINRRFYQSFAAEFIDKRSRLQPGVLRAIRDLPRRARVLELGCGPAALAAHLKQSDFQGEYLGLDYSRALLNHRPADLLPPTFRFALADLADPGWTHALPAPPQVFDAVLAFAVLHHIPSAPLRLSILIEVRCRLALSGRLYLSVWDFLKRARLRSRIVDWQEVSIDDSDLDPSDYLLDWRHGGRGLRYVHHFGREELRGLAAASGFEVEAEYQADRGLGLYQVWRVRDHFTNASLRVP
jgi:SAM-dependent methyltransferase